MHKTVVLCFVANIFFITGDIKMNLLKNVRIRLSRDHYSTIESATTSQIDDLIHKMNLLNDKDGVLSVDGLDSNGQLVSWRPAQGWFNLSQNLQDKIQNRINQISKFDNSKYQHVLHRGGADNVEKFGHGILEKVTIDDEGREYGVAHFQFKNLIWTQKVLLEDLNFVSNEITLEVSAGEKYNTYNVTEDVLALEEHEIIDSLYDIQDRYVDEIDPNLLNILNQHMDVDKIDTKLSIKIADSVCNYFGKPSISIGNTASIPNDLFEAYDLEQVRQLNGIDLELKSSLENDIRI